MDVERLPSFLEKLRKRTSEPYLELFCHRVSDLGLGPLMRHVVSASVVAPRGGATAY